MKPVLKQLFISLGGTFVLRKTNPAPRIVFWHGVGKSVNRDVEQEAFDEDVFVKQIDYLKKHYEVVSIEEFYKRLRNNKFTNKEVVLTFDDGYANNLYIAAPLLNQRGLPFTVFVSSEHITNDDLFPTSIARIIIRGAGLAQVSIPSQNLNFDLTTHHAIDKASETVSNLLKTKPLKEVRAICSDLVSNVSIEVWEQLKKKYDLVRPMTWEEVKQLSRYATIGSHCHYHICCHSAQLSEEIEKQITKSKTEIESHLGAECRFFAYPNGNFTTYSNEIVSTHYDLGFSTKATECITSKTPHSIIPRIGLPANLDTFKIIMGLYPKKQK